MAEAARLPAMFGIDSARFFPLLAYGTGLAAATRRTARMVDRVLKGERPGDIPVEQVVQPQLVVNLRVARTVGVTLPREILSQARQVVE
jgi:putative ABC transport system substrate-binding protein